MRWCCCIVLALLCLAIAQALPTRPTETVSKLTVMVDGTEVRFRSEIFLAEMPAYLINGHAMLPARFFAEVLGAPLDLHLDQWGGIVQIGGMAFRPNIPYTLTPHEAFGGAIQERWDLPLAPRIIGGRLYVPAKPTVPYLGHTMRWDAQRRVLSITTSTPKGKTMSDVTYRLQVADIVLQVNADGLGAKLWWKDVPLLANGQLGFQLDIANAAMGTPRLIAGSTADIAGGKRLTLEYAVPVGAHTYRVWQEFDVLPGSIERRLRLQRTDAAPERDALRHASLLLVGVQAGDPAATTVSIPMARFLPGMPLGEAITRPRRFASYDTPVNDQYEVTLSAPDAITGTVAVARATPALHLAVTPLPHECPATTHVYGDEGRLAIVHDFQCESWIAAGDTLTVATQLIRIQAAPAPLALPAVGRMLQERAHTPPADRPAWARDAVIYELEPGTHGGFAAATRELDALRALGYNTIYVMPWHTGGYGTLNYLQIDPKLGTLADLQTYCREAHARGMRVLFDLLVNIAAEKSRYPAEHPDWFYRDANGRPLAHPLWGGLCLDPASPGFRRFLTEYAVRCCTEWGADGFRVDAVAYRGGNWQNLPGVQPYQHSHAVFTLMEEIGTAIREVKPDAVLLAETFGPLQASWSDLVCYQWIIYMDWLQQRLLDGRINGKMLQRLLAEHLAVMPPDTWLTCYTHTHDTLAFTKHDFDGPAIRAQFAALTFLGAGIMSFGGGWGMPERPKPDERDDYRALFAMKARLGGVIAGEVSLPATDDPALLVYERPSALGKVRVTTNFSAETRPLPATGKLLFTLRGSAKDTIAPYDTVIQQR